MKSALSFGAVLAVVLFLPGSNAAALDVATILHRSVEANLRNYEALPRFNYFKVGRGPDGTTRTYDEIMLFGSPYPRLVAIDGEPLSPDREMNS